MPTPTQCPPGHLMSLYYNTGTDMAQTWVEHEGIIEDMVLNDTEELNQMSGRRTGRDVIEYGPGDTEVSISGTQITDTSYEGWLYLYSLRTAGVSRDLMGLTGKIGVVGSKGWRGHWRNSDRTINGPAQGGMTTAFNIQPAAPCDSTWVEVRPVQIATADTVSDYDPATTLS